MWSKGYVDLRVKASHSKSPSTNVDVDRHCVIGDIIGLVFPKIFQGHGIKGLCDMMGKSLSEIVTILPIFVAIGIVVVEIKWF